MAAVAFAVLVLVLGAVSSASASPASASLPPVSIAPGADQSSVMAVGWGNRVAVNRSLFQCPSPICNQGQAYPGNDLAEVCTYTMNGETWGLVFNRANLHTGFIPTWQLMDADPPDSCHSVGTGGWVNYDNTPMYQCPSTICNRGNANRGEDIGLICVWWGNGGAWVWALNHANQHEGFIWNGNDGAGLPAC